MTTKTYFVKVSWEEYRDNKLIREHKNITIGFDFSKRDCWELIVLAEREATDRKLVNNFTIDFMIEVP